MPRFTLSALSRATALHRVGLAAAILLPLCTELQADPSAAPSPTTQQQPALTGHFLNLGAAASNRRSAEIGTDQLRQATGLSIRNLAPATGDTYKGLSVQVGKTFKLSRSQQQSEDDVVISSRADGSFVALLPQANAIIRGSEDGQQTLLRYEGPENNEHSQDSLEAPEPAVAQVLQARSGQLSYQLERNQAGELVIDLLAGFSEKSAQYIGDAEAYALSQVAVVNQAIKNTQIEGVRVRLVGIQIVAEDMPITTPALAQVKELFAEGIKQYSPDLIASFVRSGSGQDSASGWGYVNGRYTINDITSSNVFRHEMAHNVGGGHCSDGTHYRFGHNNGRVRTILCGNTIPYFSNPDISDSQGVPLGNAQTANMARLWRERAAKISAYAPAVVPLDGEQASTLLSQNLDLAKNEIRYFPLDIPAGTQRLVFNVVPGLGYESPSNVQLLLKQGSQPTTSDYDFRSVQRNSVSLAVNNPQAGRWYLGLRGDTSKAASHLVLDGKSFALKEETVKARFVKLVANSSVDGQANASIAELHLADAHGKSLPRTWNIHSASSALSTAPASNILDGNPKSYWASTTGSTYPHQLVLDLGQDTRFSQLHYLPRQDQGVSGNIKAYQVYAAAKAEGPWTPIASGEFSADNEVKSAPLKPQDSVLPPVAVISGVSEATADQQVVLDASASSDPKGHALDFSWRVTPALDFKIDGTRLSFVAPKLSSDTRYKFILKLSNGKQASIANHDVLIKASVATSSCKPQWEATKAYWENDQVQHNGRLYMARWWIKGGEPGNSSYTGADGSGKVWKDLGTCDSNGSNNNAEVAAPVAKITGVAQAKAGEQVTLNASGSTDPAGLALTYRWSVSPDLSFNANGAQLTFVAPQNSQDVTYRFKLDLSNGQKNTLKEHSVKVSAETSGQPSSCQGPWSAKTAYQTGSKVSHKGKRYTARWWTQGNEPGNPAFTGPEGSGKVWRDEGSCN
ncbi:discoidin domain-containing protein [Pseudomonas sp. 5P_3.1_Bac2]|uniref:discoidin domain-containing protein n=1 Tax=Pseudomonas sp. 5P_3.1_Bac2 TaxID=2971617 RepID=UPI0021CA36CE|nr:discoidin domain-containing protein [Pseudomonas sp. 5P_3.1_Bac2]MCU1719624.1 discoidin domain-containing protein [Pseudomonas sp. 5P_3.1_Bac2]